MSSRVRKRPEHRDAASQSRVQKRRRGGHAHARIAQLSAIPADAFAGPHLGAILGVVQAGGGLGGAIGPVLGGWLFDVTGSYHLAFTAACLAVAGSAVAAWIATRQAPIAATTRPVMP